MLCPRCGKETKLLGFCKDCFSEMNPIRLKKFSLPLCECEKYRYKGVWKNNLKESLIKIVSENLLVPDGVLVEVVDVFPKFDDNRNIPMEIEIKAKYEGKSIEQVFKGEIRLEKGLCDVCKDLKSYSAILQFRGFEPSFRMKQENISNVERKHGGLDFYITSKDYAREIAKKFNKKKGRFEVKESQKLIGIDEKGRKKSRLTISIRKREG